MRSAVVWLLFLPNFSFSQEPKPGVDALVRVFDDGSEGVLKRLRAGRALVWLGPAAAPAIPRLRARLRDPDTCIRRRAAFVLSRIDRTPGSWGSG